jgi:hypothetical protein
VAPAAQLPDDVRRAVTTLGWLIGQVESLVSGKFVAGGSALRFVFRQAVPRAILTARSIHLLLENGVAHGLDAVALSRSLWELLVSLEYIYQCARHREELALRYLAQNTHKRRNHLAYMRAQPNPDAAAIARVDQNITGDERQLLKYFARAIESTQPSRRAALQEALTRWRGWTFRQTWAGISRSRMARSIHISGVNRAWEYDHAYDMLSEASHVSSGSLIALGAAFDPDAYPEDQGRDPARVAASLASIWLLQLIDLVARELEPAWRTALVPLSDAATEQWRRAGIIRRR